MNSYERLKKAIDYLKNEIPNLSNELISAAIGYRSKTYVSDILGKSKPLNDIFLSKLEVEYSVSSEWVKNEIGLMILNPKKIEEIKRNSQQGANQTGQPFLVSNEDFRTLLNDNHTLVQTNKTLADAHYIEARNIERLLNKIDGGGATVHSGIEILPGVHATLSEVLGSLARAGCGKSWKTEQEGEAILHSYLYASQKAGAKVGTQKS